MLTAYRITLTGAEQVPVVVTSATGLGTAIFDSATTSLFYTITTVGLDWGPVLGRPSQTPSALDDINGQHFHSGARGVNGGVVFDWLSQDSDDFNATLNGDGSWTISGRWETTDPGSTIASFAAALGSTTVGADAPLYANIHTVANGGGEIRGQFVGANTWNGPGNLWSLATNWSGGIPQATHDVVIPAGTVTPLLDNTTGSTTVASITVADGASFDIKTTGANIAVTGNFTDDGGVGIDSQAFDPGGTTLVIGGTLTVTNAGAGFAVGNYLQGSDNTNPQPHGTPSTSTVTAASVTNTGAITIQSYDALGSVARLMVGSAAGFGGQAGVLTGIVNIGTDGLHAGSQGLLHFASGQITTIGTAAKLNLYGAHAHIASGGATGSNSAITGLSTINGSGGLLKLQNQVQVTTGALTTLAGGSINVDTDALGAAGSVLTIGGQLTNNGTLGIGRSGMTGDALVTVSSLSSTGTISLSGDTGTNSTGRLVVNAPAGFGTAGVLTGNVNMEGKSVLEFASGQITTIASNSTLAFIGGNAFIADTGATTSNSALTGLSTVSGGLTLQTSVSLAISGSLTIGGAFSQDTGFLGTAGSSTTVGGTLTVNGNFTIGRQAMIGDTTVTVGALAGTGSISLNGDVDDNFTGRLIVNSAAPGTITNNITVQEKSLLQFASGQINTIAFGGSITVIGTNAFIADAGATTSNSALTGLTNVSGAFTLMSGASLATTAGLTVGNGTNGASINASGGSGLTINGALANNANCSITVGNGFDSASTTVTATGLTNAGSVTVNGNTANGGVNHGNLVINGAASNTGQINVATGSVHVTGVFSGAGTVALSNGGVLQFDSSSSGGAINFGAGQSTLKVGSAAISNALTGFDTGDTIDLMSRIVTGLSYSGTTLTANIQGGGTDVFNLTGTFNGFSATSDGNSGTNVVGLGNSFSFTAGMNVVLFTSGTNTATLSTATFNAGDSLTGGSGADTANLTGGGSFDFGSQLSGFDQITLDDNSYSLTMADANVATGQTLTVSAAALTGGHTLNMLGTAEANGHFMVTGGAGGDTIISGSGNDTLNGGAGGDLLFGGAGGDTLTGGAEGDFLDGGAGGDGIDGGDGFDLVSWLLESTGATVNLANAALNAGSAAGDTVTNVEGIYLTNSADSYTGGAAGLFVYGFGGNDTLIGSSESDFFDGGAGADTIDAGGGFDYVSYNSASAAVTLNLQNPANNTGDAAGDTISNADAYILTEFGDTFIGLASGQNIVSGYGGNDTLTGGFNANNWFFGGDGNDRMVGGGVADLYVGGNGADTIVPVTGTPIAGSSVFGFETGVDQIEISRSAFGLSAGYAVSNGSTFAAGTSPTNTVASPTFLYYTDLGLLYFDPDGAGATAATLLMQLAGASALTANDFHLV